MPFPSISRFSHPLIRVRSLFAFSELGAACESEAACWSVGVEVRLTTWIVLSLEARL